MIPYGLMTLLNILCGIVTPSYTAVYMVENSVMREAIRRGGVFEGVVGELAEKHTPTSGKFQIRVLEENSESPPTGNTEPQSSQSGSPAQNTEQKKPYPTAAIQNGEFKLIGTKTQIMTTINTQIKIAVPLLRIFSGQSRIPKPQAQTGPFTSFRKIWDKLKDFNRRRYSELPTPETYCLDSFRGIYEPNDNKYDHFVFPIGNVLRNPRPKYAPLFTDLLIVTFLLFPYITVYLITKTSYTNPKSPNPYSWHGKVFLAILIIGQVSSFFTTASWGIIHSHESYKRKRMNHVGVTLLIFVCVVIFFLPLVVLGCSLVAYQKYQELSMQNPNCCKSKNAHLCILQKC
jgi:hypothetical protein